MSTLSVPIKLFHPTTTTSSFLHSHSQTLTFIPSRTPTVRASASTSENPHKAFGHFLRQRLYFNTPNGLMEHWSEDLLVLRMCSQMKLLTLTCSSLSLDTTVYCSSLFITNPPLLFPPFTSCKCNSAAD
ncbi:hypothetical protein Ahy_A07g034487 [Arachis hypogaea]|uniref:Uncharacterized protein n=1 Tax=Arachis hypogaea TaxID=3818 RepID=A0A445CBY6_ARAHY|nr:hypothetical protein Ahy_A07g034487 [Arachis hypogaea]